MGKPRISGSSGMRSDDVVPLQQPEKPVGMLLGVDSSLERRRTL
jgi:hypothetical protein